MDKIKKIINKNFILRIMHDKVFDLYFEVDSIIRYLKSDKNRFIELKNVANNKRCFIIGNGPSLKIEDLEKLKYEDTFAVNRIYKIFGKTKWRPTYYCSHDTKILNEIIYDLDNELKSCKIIFLNSSFKGKIQFILCKSPYYFFGVQKEFYPNKPNFSEKVEKGLYEGYTVIYTCIQLAVYMGYKEIYLLGLDHSYNLVKMADGTIKEEEGKANYMQGVEGKNYFLPQLEKTELSYKKAREVCEAKNILIKNATRGGKLEVFERINFDNLFEDKHE